MTIEVMPGFQWKTLDDHARPRYWLGDTAEMVF
jgi:hypothetical protein